MKRDYYSGFSFFSLHTNWPKYFLNVLQNIIAPNCTIWSSELNQKGFSCFPAEHTIPGETKGSPLTIFFRHCETFFRKIFFLKGSPFNCDKNVDNFGSVPLLARQGLALAGPGAPLCPFFWVCNFFEKFSIFECWKREYLTLVSLFAIFEPWIWRRLGPVPACFQL